MAIQSNSITHTFAIENTGNQTLNISDIIVSGIDYTVISAISFIAPGTADTFTITLSGSAIGTFNSTITIVSDDADENPFTFDVSGTITAPEINVFVGLDNTGTVVTNGQTTVVDLGSAVEGNNIIQTIAIENTGTSDLAIGSITSSATEYTVGGIPTTVAAGSTQTFTITLNGTTPGIFNTTITIVNDDADENPFTFDINGSITTPEISIFLGADNSGVAITAGQTGSIDYGSAIVGNDIVQSFAIENTGTSILNITNITSSSADFTVTSSITSIATGITETFEVTLSGANVGTFNTTITVESDDTDEALFDFSVIGTIEPPPAPEINVFLGSGNTAPAINDAQPEPINVGTGMLENDFTQTFAIENTGTFVLNVSSISITGTDYTVNSSISAIAVGTTETFDVILSAATPGIFDAIVTITSNDLDEGEFTFSITGTILGMNIIEGEVPSGNVLISNQQVNLGSTPLSVNIEKAFVIQNLSTSNELEINGIESDNPVFEVENKNTKVATSEFVQFMVTLVALTPGTYQANISVSTSVNDFVFIVTGEVLEGVLPELNVFNAVTPNGDSVHDFLKIGNIDFYPDNTLVIYNRWGDKVFETTGYDNVNNTFIGNANVGSADELETGNYFYRIDKGGDYGKISGYLFLKR